MNVKNISNIRFATNQGFALLITLVVVSVILAIGLSLLFVTTKQYLLSVTANESEKAFQSAQIGLDCMRYHRANANTRAQFLREGGAWPPVLSCAGMPSIAPETNSAINIGGGIWLYNYVYKYSINNNRCAEPSVWIADLRNSTGNLNYNLSGEGLSNITCTAGTICTVIFGRGYNRPCGQLNNSIYTIQREITIQY